IVDHREIDMEFRDVMADVLLGRIAEQRELRAVGPEDDPFGTHPVHAVSDILDEVLELLLSVSKRRLDALAFRQRTAQHHLDTPALVDLGFERQSPALEAHERQPAPLVDDAGITDGHHPCSSGGSELNPVEMVTHWQLDIGLCRPCSLTFDPRPESY